MLPSPWAPVSWSWHPQCLPLVPWAHVYQVSGLHMVGSSTQGRGWEADSHEMAHFIRVERKCTGQRARRIRRESEPRSPLQPSQMEVRSWSGVKWTVHLSIPSLCLERAYVYVHLLLCYHFLNYFQEDQNIALNQKPGKYHNKTWY